LLSKYRIASIDTRFIGHPVLILWMFPGKPVQALYELGGKHLHFFQVLNVFRRAYFSTTVQPERELSAFRQRYFSFFHIARSAVLPDSFREVNLHTSGCILSD